MSSGSRRKHLRSRLYSSASRGLVIGLGLLLLAGGLLPAQAQVVISEFVADNVLGRKDEDGDSEDWIELQNLGIAAVDLAGWRLTDEARDPVKWVFPSVTLAPGEYLLVYASGKDRRLPGRPWHTNFRLSSSGEYLGLLRPDGTVASEFSPAYPPQVPDVSYGLPAASVPVNLVTAESPARWLVPVDAGLEGDWFRAEFQESGWARGVLGLGWDRTDPAALVTVADSQEDWTASGEQGVRGWRYGFYSRTADPNGTYSAAEFTEFPPAFWEGTEWRSPGGLAPWDRLGRTVTRPTGLNSGEERWMVRRWISTVSGTVTVTWSLAKRDTRGTGVSGRLFHNGSQRDNSIITGTDTQGIQRTVVLSGVQIGDTIDMAVVPFGAGSVNDDIGDESDLRVSMAAAGATSTWIQTDLESSMRGRNASVYVRVPFVVTNLAELDRLELRLRYNDGVAVFLNGESVARRNAPVEWPGGPVADSIQDWSAEGAQGVNGWYQGLYRKSDDPDGRYDAGSEFESVDDQWKWEGDAWVLGPGDPPWTTIGRTEWHPNGSDGNAEVQWAIRRWVCQTEGDVKVLLSGAKSNVGCGNGVTFRVLLNGEEQFQRVVAFNDAKGFATTLDLRDLRFGDLLDFVLDPTGTDGSTQDGCDGSTFAAQVTQDASPGLTWNAHALRARSPSETSRSDTFDLTGDRDRLVNGTNVLAFQVLNANTDDPDLLLAPELVARVTRSGGVSARYFTSPSPGGVNANGVESLGALVTDTRHEPAVPADADPLKVLAQVRSTLKPVASVTLQYRVMYGAETTMAMADDGLHGDGAAGDGWWGAIIPASAASPGQMIRWAVTTRDAEGRAMRFPTYSDPRRSPQYLGTMVRDSSSASSSLPVLHWFLQNATAADSDAGTRGSVFYEGEFYDNVGANLHGQSTRGFPKKSYDFDFNPGHHFRWRVGEGRVDDFNLLTTWADKSHLRTVMAYETYAAAGAPGHFAFPVRVQLNGRFHAVANLVENGDEGFLKRVGLNPQGALYKMYNSAESVSGAEKKTRKTEGTQDLADLQRGFANGTAAVKEAFMYDNLDVPEVVNFLATRALTGDTDCCHKNYYLYRDTPGSGEWMAFPWDVDLSFGRVWTCGTPCYSYFDETIYTNTGLFVGDGNRVFSLVLSTPATRQMYLRRVQTLAEQLTQRPGVAPDEDHWLRRSSEWRNRIAPDAALDLAKWGTWGRRETITQAVDRIQKEFLPGRRRYLFGTLSSSGGLPAPQPTNVVVNFGAFEVRPSSGNPLHAFLSVTNPNPYAVDLSDWSLDGIVRFRFKPGTVLAARGVAFVSPDRRAFRSRTVSPRGTERRMVLGDYEGELSNRGGTVALLDRTGRRVSEMTVAGATSPVQDGLRITEIHFNPAPADVEFLELQNVGASPLDLSGARFTEGILLAFPATSAPVLAPGERVVVVSDPVRFAARYGARPRIAGVYSGSLDNSGERLRLEDAAGQPILDFNYPGNSSPLVDGLGFSLVPTDPGSPWERWGEAGFWRVGSTAGGTPGDPEVNRPASPQVVVSEVLAHTDPPQLDAVELWNPGTTPADVGGWWITDDPLTPAKFRIPERTIIAPGGRWVVDETQLDRPLGAPTAFTFSSHGDSVWLLSADSSGSLTGWADGFRFPASANGVSFGRHTNSTGETRFVPQEAVTLGAPNAGPRIGPVVFEEIHASPVRGGIPFLELRNVSASEVPLYDPESPTNTWRIEGVDFEFPPGQVLPPGGLIVVVGGDPLDFRIRHGVPSGVPVLGPWNGALDQDGERLELLRPDPPDVLPDGSVLVPWIGVDTVRYSDSAPWPDLRHAVGASLERKPGPVYGDDPASWILNRSGPTPGLVGGANRSPVVRIAEVAPIEAQRFPVVVSLQGSVSDDGMPAVPGRVTARWSAPGAPGLLVLGSLESEQTTVSLPGPGRYAIRLTAFDGELSGVAEVILEVGRPQTSGAMVPQGARWRYWDRGTSPDTGWTLPQFDDRAWSEGAAQLGYGDGDEATALRDTVNGARLLTAYFRTSWRVADPAGVTSLGLKLMRDDGAAVWINGVEVMRSNLPEGPLEYGTLAPATVSGTDESAFFEQAVDPKVLRAGTNVIAVEVHQQNAASSDVSFDLELGATTTATNLAPVVEAGPDLQAKIGEAFDLVATWSDDGLPGAPVLRWSQVSGPASARWSETRSARVRVDVPVAGTYEFLVTVDDGQATATDAVRVRVEGTEPGYDAWKALHFSAAEIAVPAISGDAADPDGDGQPNRAEFDSGTRPRDAASVLRARAVSDAGGGIRILVPGVAGRTYEVQTRTDWEVSGWTSLERLGAVAKDGEIEVLDRRPVVAGAARYYRVVTPAP